MAKDLGSDLSIIDRNTSNSESGESLAVYMKAIQKLPLLSRADEISLAETIRDNKAAIISVCCEVSEFFTELFLLKELSLTEQKKLFSAYLNEDSGREDVANLQVKLGKLLESSFKKEADAHDNLLNFLQPVNFTLQDLKRISKPVKTWGTKLQVKRLNEHLKTFQTAKDRMVTANLRLVFSRAKIYLNKGLALEDLLQEGNLGLIKAIEKYDVSKGFKFGTYATWWIDQALGRAVADKSRLIRVPVHMVENINKISKVNKALTQKLGRVPTIEELSEASELDIDKIKKVQDISVFPQSMEETPGETGVALAEYLVDHETTDPFAVVEQREISDRVKMMLSKLEPREEKIIRMRFGIGERKPVFFNVIGESCNISGERVRQLFDRSIKKLKTHGANEVQNEDDWTEFKRGNRNTKSGSPAR